ncbi:arginine N-succinyltransferase [Escherichia coli]|nr:arginine N-succinyltransferase [Escherichia coli]
MPAKTGGSLTSLPANEATLSARIESWQSKPGKANCPKVSRAMCSCWKIARQAPLAGICAIEVAVGLNDPWYNYRVGTLVHASKELNVYNALPTLFPQ